MQQIVINEYGEPTKTSIKHDRYCLIQEGYLLTFPTRREADYFLKQCNTETYRAGKWCDINFGFNGIANLSRIYSSYFKCKKRPTGYVFPKTKYSGKATKQFSGDCYQIIDIPCRKGDGKGKNKKSSKRNYYDSKNEHKFDAFKKNW